MTFEAVGAERKSTISGPPSGTRRACTSFNAMYHSGVTMPPTTPLMTIARIVVVSMTVLPFPFLCGTAPQ